MVSIVECGIFLEKQSENNTGGFISARSMRSSNRHLWNCVCRCFRLIEQSLTQDQWKVLESGSIGTLRVQTGHLRSIGDSWTQVQTKPWGSTLEMKETLWPRYLKLPKTEIHQQPQATWPWRNYAGQTLSVNQVLQVKLTLVVSAPVSGITNFSFDILITATG
jgi:hypothetical protein